jgi:retinol-binding protein 3
MSFARALDPRTETNWESTGVMPDINVDTKDALGIAREKALQTLLKNVNDQSTKFRIKWALEELNFEQNPPTLNEGSLFDYVGIYGFRKIKVDNGHLVHERDGFPGITLIPTGKDKFALEGISSLQFQFVRDTSYKVVQLIGLYDNGNRESLNRTVKINIKITGGKFGIEARG